MNLFTFFPIALELKFLISTPKRYLLRKEASIPTSKVIVFKLPIFIPSDPSPVIPEDLPKSHCIKFAVYPSAKCELLSFCSL